MSKRRNDLICKNCGKTYHPKAADRDKYCSRDCYFIDQAKRKEERIKKEAAAKIKQCKICGSSFTQTRTEVYCSDDCRKRKACNDSVKNNSAKKVLRARICKECGLSFIPEYGNKKRVFCSTKCLKKYQRRSSDSQDARHRAQRFDVDYEYINVIKVFDRDGWRCQLCGKNTPQKNRGTCYTNAPELDHRIPMSKGGGHLYSNVQCACRKCNGLKSNKNERGQIPLFDVKRKSREGRS